MKNLDPQTVGAISLVALTIAILAGVSWNMYKGRNLQEEVPSYVMYEPNDGIAIKKYYDKYDHNRVCYYAMQKGVLVAMDCI